MSRMCRNCLKPAPRGPRRFSSGHPAVGEGQRPGVRRVPAHLAVRLALLVAGRAVLDDEVRDLRAAVVARHRGDRDVARQLGARVGDELLGAVDDPLAAVEARAGLDVAGVGAGLGLGQAERAELAAGAQVGEVPGLLLLAAEQVDRLGAERGVRAHRDRDARVHARELLDGDRVLQRRAARPAVLLRERDAHPPELAHLAHDVGREALGPVELLGDRRHFLHREVADGALQQLGVVGQVENHRTMRIVPRESPAPA
jgi:hypothetical protein